LFLKLDEVEVKGERSEEIFQLETNQFPLQWIKQIALLTTLPLNRAAANQTHQGTVSGKIAVNLDTMGQETLPLFEAEAEIIDGEMQDLLAALQIFEFQDLRRGLTPPTYNNSQDLYLGPTNQSESSNPPLVSVGFPEESRDRVSIQSQLRRFSAIGNLLKQQKRQRELASPFPDLIALQGSFNSKLTVSNTVENQLKAEFKFDGGSEEKPWRWGSYVANLVTLQGKYEHGTFSLNPATIKTTNGMSVQVSGSLNNNTNTLSGTVLKIEQFPIEVIRDLWELPAAIGSDGTIGLQANISGSINNPSVIGVLEVNDGIIEQTKIPQIKGSLTYYNSLFGLQVGSRFAEGTGETNHVALTVSIPYQLPISTVKPDSNQLNLTISVVDEGMRLLNIASKEQIKWLNGKAAVDLRVTAPFDQEAGKIRLGELLVHRGDVQLENATIQIQALPDEPLSQVHGNISFNLDSIQVDSLAGEFSGGKVSVKGNLPLAKPIPQDNQDNPLTVILDELAFNLKSLYKGGVSGSLVIVGTALEPKIKGEVDLFNGTVFLGEQKPPSSSEEQKSLFQFQNLVLKLGNKIEIAQPPISNFLATGDLALYGTLQNPRLNGKVKLPRGQVNLFTTQFQLTGGEEHTAFFNNGLDPFLDVNLKASVTEKTRKGIPTDPLSAEVSVSDIPALDIGGLQTVRIQAKVFGPASKLTENLQLTSSPPRSETEIVNLLGGGLLETITGVDTTLGLANLAGSAILGTFQNTIGNALGLSEFRLFPALITDDENRSSTLGLGAEVSVDLSQNFSFSALKIINSPQPFQYGIIYHWDDFLLLRGSTDLSGDDRGAIEYEFKF